MPLVTLSKILSSKTLARTSQLYPSGSSDSGAEHTGSLTLKSSRRPSSSVNDLSKIRTSPKQEKGGSVRSRDSRTSKSFTFSLDPFSVVASIRTRPKSRGGLSSVIHPESSLSSRTVSHKSQSVYSGYEDEDYGEPEVDAEEIRRPSGLGRRASLTDISTEVGDDVVKYSIDPESIREFQPPVQSVTEDEAPRNSVSDAGDSESLVEIRYPSGLGNIKLIVPQIEEQRPQSTYPHFQPSVVDLSTRIEDEEARTPIPREVPLTIPSLQSPPISLSTLLPILGLYLSPQSLASLALVDRAVGQEARALLWKYINVSVTISSSQAKRLTVDGHTSSNILAAIDTGKVGHHIKSLELTCRLDSTATRLSSNFPRSRPPPLILVPKTATPLRAQNTFTPPPASTQLRSAPLPSEVIPQVQPSHVAVATGTIVKDDPVTLSKMRRASLMLRNSSISMKYNVPDALRASAAKFRSTSIRLPRSLSLLRSHSSECIGTSALTSASASSSSSEDPTPVSYFAETSMAPFNGPSHAPETEEMSTPEQHSIVTDATQDSSPSSSAPLPSTGWTPPPEWYATPSLISSPPSSLRSSLQIRPRPPSLSSLTHHSDLRLSPSLPSLRAPHILTPTYQHPPASEDAPPSPMTAAPSPVTPYSAISLSAFPLPPPSITPPSSVAPFRPQFSPLHSPVPDHSVDGSSSIKSVITPKKAGEDHVIESEWESGFGLPKALARALERMVNLECMTIKYVSSESKGPMLTQMPSYTRMRESIDLSLVKKANETLGMALPSLESLRCLRVVCQKGQEEVCRTQWEGTVTRTPSLKDLDLNVTSVQDLDTTNS